MLGVKEVNVLFLREGVQRGTTVFANSCLTVLGTVCYSPYFSLLTLKNKSKLVNHLSVCMCIAPPVVPRQRFGKHVPAATNTQATVQELLDASSSMRFVS
jgi:hypothetical protein